MKTKMTTDREQCSIIAIECARKLHRSLAMKLAEQGMTLEDISIASLYSSLDLASTLTQSPVAAIEWLRTGLDVQERSVLDAAATHQ